MDDIEVAFQLLHMTVAVVIVVSDRSLVAVDRHSFAVDHHTMAAVVDHRHNWTVVVGLVLARTSQAFGGTSVQPMTWYRR